MTNEEQDLIRKLRQSIEPKSDQINADDFLTGPRTVTITNVRAVSGEQPVALGLEGMLPYLPCKSMRRALIACWGENGKEWIGRKMTLYCDPSVTFGNVALGGIRISHLSHITRDTTLMLTKTRSRRTPVVIKQLVEDAKQILEYPDEGFEQNREIWVNAINNNKITYLEVTQRLADKGFRLTNDQALSIQNAIKKA